MRDHRAVSIQVSGRVQGVWYRGWTVRRATELGLIGWVRNRQDGSVEVLAVGPNETIEKLLVACRRGPPAARVDEITQEDVSEVDLPTAGFFQRPTV